MEKLKPLTPWQQKMAHTAYEKAKAFGDPDPVGFVSQLMAESQMDPNAASSADARGLAQFIPGTAKRFGLTDPTDPLASMDAALKYRSVIRKYNRKRGITGEDYVWAGYNAGEGAAAQARHGYAETRGYVNRIEAYKPQFAAILGQPYDASVEAQPPSGGMPSGGMPSGGMPSGGAAFYGGGSSRNPIVRGGNASDTMMRSLFAAETPASPSMSATQDPDSVIESMFQNYIASVMGSSYAN